MFFWRDRMQWWIPEIIWIKEANWRNVLLRGGNAADAAVAASICIGALNPHSSGLGGGFMMTFYKRLAPSFMVCKNDFLITACCHLFSLSVLSFLTSTDHILSPHSPLPYANEVIPSMIDPLYEPKEGHWLNFYIYPIKNSYISAVFIQSLIPNDPLCYPWCFSYSTLHFPILV